MFIGENGEVYIGDYKHTKGVDAEAILQQLVYKRIIETARNSGSSSKDVIGMLKQAGIRVDDVGLKEQEINALLGSKGKINNILATTDNEGGTTIKTI
jgi:hypothetical protein